MALKVLLVDDDVFTIALQEMLVEVSDLSSEPISFKNGKFAMDYLDEHYNSGDLYLILLDINMPVMDGWMFLNAIQSKPLANNILIVMVSSSTNNEDRKRAFQYNQVIDYIEKPLELEVCTKLLSMPQLVSHLNA